MRALGSLALRSSRANNLNDSDFEARSCIAHCVSVHKRNDETASLADGTPISRIAIESTDMADSPLTLILHHRDSPWVRWKHVMHVVRRILPRHIRH